MRFGMFGSVVRLAAAAAVFSSSAAAAAQFKIQPIADFRVRHEAVSQEGLSEDANALTFRARQGVELASGAWRVLAEAEATGALLERYDSGLNGRLGHPLVADPQSGEINRLQLQYRGLPKTVLIVGRQRINMDDQRFVGNSGWRQNEQTFDAARLEYGEPAGLKANVAYAWSVRTIWGADGRGARQTAIDGDNILATVSHPSPIGTLGGFLFVVDQDEEIVSTFRQSSRTLGARLSGRRPLSTRAGLAYVLSYARQRDSGRNPNDYRASFSLAELTVELGATKFAIGREVLGADDGRAFTSFQTPLATLHKFQGWADKFLVTPPNGLRDLYASAGHGWKGVGGFDAVSAQLSWHRFRSDRLGLHYGNELNAILSAKTGRWTATAKLADYRADAFATDTRKAWLQLEWSF